MRTLALATLTAAAALAAAPSFAQISDRSPYPNQSVEELTVTGHVPGPRPMTMSERVSYADLDLRFATDRDRLEKRVSYAAHRVCDRLNEADRNPANMGKSCRDVAVRDAMSQVRQAYADASASPAYVDAYGTPTSATAPDQVSYNTVTVDNGPIPDTPANRARYGAPLSHAGKRTAAAGN